LEWEARLTSALRVTPGRAVLEVPDKFDLQPVRTPTVNLSMQVVVGVFLQLLLTRSCRDTVW
jgi:hypothetical protein